MNRTRPAFGDSTQTHRIAHRRARETPTALVRRSGRALPDRGTDPAWKRVFYIDGRLQPPMPEPTADRPPSALVMFLKANWKWLVIVVAAAIVVMMVASD